MVALSSATLCPEARRGFYSCDVRDATLPSTEVEAQPKHRSAAACIHPDLLVEITSFIAGPETLCVAEKVCKDWHGCLREQEELVWGKLCAAWYPSMTERVAAVKATTPLPRVSLSRPSPRFPVRRCSEPNESPSRVARRSQERTAPSLSAKRADTFLGGASLCADIWAALGFVRDGESQLAGGTLRLNPEALSCAKGTVAAGNVKSELAHKGAHSRILFRQRYVRQKKWDCEREQHKLTFGQRGCAPRGISSFQQRGASTRP